MGEQLSIHQLCNAANVTRTQLNQWIARGYFTPSENPENGKARSFTIREAISLAVFAELARLGTPYDYASQASANLHGFKNDEAVLVIYNAPVEIISTSGKKVKAEMPGQIQLARKILPAKDFAKFTANTEIQSLSLVYLARIEERVMASLDADA